MKPIELRRKGEQVLVDNLGQINTIRFLQQMGWAHGDYTKEREELLKGVTREEFLQNLERIRNL
ncbi:MAG: hypothetical protein F6K40_13205 [Okeania sp. SIO3I5]|uniref:hypothetical protein n=1 Tax=Okeania sp. SIO3I5 TaxID=2607805 RepID=UPI0013B9F95A|nr:hypothetical protein [Okeania sp. SIO3I5]NEQ37170.1 hypothetical protein [Okeania sp. SIO3I5]